MAKFKVEKFDGMAPAVSPRLLSNNYAQSAQNINFLSGRLDPIKDDATVATSTTNSNSAPIKSIYPYAYDAQSSSSASHYIASLTIATIQSTSTYEAKGYLGFSGQISYGSLGTASDSPFQREYALAAMYVFKNSAGYFLDIWVDEDYHTGGGSFDGTVGHFGTNTSLNFFTDAACSSALSGAPSISQMDDDPADATLTFNSGRWTKTISEAEYNSFVSGNTIYFKFTNALISTETTETLGTTNKSYVYKAALFSNLQYPPARYIATDYNGIDNYVFTEYIKISGDQRSKLSVGATIKGEVDTTSGAKDREAEVLYFAYDGTDTTIFFKRTHHIATGTVTSTTTSATNLIDGTSGAVVNTTADNELIVFSVTNYGVRDRGDSLVSNDKKATGYITDNTESSNTVVVNDLFNNRGTTGSFREGSRYVISVEPNITKHTVNDPSGRYWDAPGVQGCFSGFFESIALSGNVAPSVATGGHHGVGDTRSGAGQSATSFSGLGFDPYFATRQTITTKSMLRTILAGTTWSSPSATSSTVGDTINYWYGAPVVTGGTVTGKVNDTQFVDSALASLFNGNDELNGFYFHNLTTRASAQITDYVASNGTLIFGTLSGGDDATITNGDSYEITAGENAYSYEWRSYHKDHPVSKIVGAFGNMGVIICPVEALTSDHISAADTDRTADDTGTPGNDSGGNAKITLGEGDVVQFGGWGIDATQYLQNQVNAAGTSSVFYTNLNYGDAKHAAGVGSAVSSAPFFRPAYNLNWRTNVGLSGADAESHSDDADTTFDAAHGGPYWQIISKPIKVHVYNGLITPFETNQTIVTGQHTGSNNQTSVLTDAFKNFEPDLSFLVGKTLVNTTKGWKATITSNTATTITFEEAAYIDVTKAAYNHEHIAAFQDALDFDTGDEYYIQEAIPGIDTLGDDVLAEDFFTFRALSVVSLDNYRHIYTEGTASFGVYWFCSRYANTTVQVVTPNKNKQVSYLEFDETVSVTKSPVDSDKYNRIYWTGQDYPRMAGTPVISTAQQGDATVAAVNWAGTSTDNSFRLGIPAPQRALIPTNTAGSDITFSNVSEVLAVSYVYTYVSVFGEEGPPSPPTIPVDFQFGQEVILTGIGNVEGPELITNSEYNFGTGALKRIYRSNTGSTDTLYQFLDEIPFSKTTYTDVKDSSALGEVLPSGSWVGQPDDDDYLNPTGPMKGLTELDNGMFAGFTGRRLCFSEPFLPHAWPVEYRITIENDIVALGSVANGVFVLTTGKPYFFGGNDPSAMVGSQIDFAQACVNENSVVDMGDAVYYAGPDGLCRITTNSAEIISARLIDYSSWISEFEAYNYVASRHENKYVALFSSILGGFDGFVFDPQSPDSALSLITRDAIPISLYNDEASDNLYIVEKVDGSTNQAIKQYRAGSGLATYSWKSKKFTATAPVSMSWIGVYADSYPNYTGSASATPKLEVTVTADGTDIFKANISKSGNVYYQETTTPSTADISLSQPIMRLPDNRAQEWEITITGDDSVNEICLAQSMEEIITQ